MNTVDLSQRRLLNTDEAAKALGFSGRHLRNMRSTLGLPCVKIGGAVRFDTADLLAWIARQKH